MLIALGVSIASFAAFYALMAHDLREPHGFGTSLYLWYSAGAIVSFGTVVGLGITLLVR